MRIEVYSRHDAYIGTIAGDDLLSAVHTDELNGADTLSITTTFPLSEGMRLVWRDSRGACHEHVCQDPKGTRADGGGVVYTDTALNSICELFGDYIVDKRPYGYSFSRALEVALEPTRWEVGTVDQAGTVDSGLNFYHTSAREALSAIIGCGGELETEIAVGAGGVESRRVSIRSHRGETGGHRRFSYGKDLLSVARTEHWGAITACYGYGKGLETENGGYTRKLTFGDVNGGKDYVEDADALAAYGRPDGSGGMAHVFGIYENPDCEDANQLLEETEAYLTAHCMPGVSYEAKVADLMSYGRMWEGVGVGDDVQIVDTCFDPPLRCEGRVSSIKADLLGDDVTITLGNIAETMADALYAQQSEIGSMASRSYSWDAMAGVTPSYLQRLLHAMNGQFNLSGMSYCNTSFEHGTIWSSVPLDADGNPTRTGGSAIQLCSQGLRIAGGTKADGSFDWTTFGTGDGFTASAFRAGTITDAAGKSSWNLESGELSVEGTLTSRSGSDVTNDVQLMQGSIVFRDPKTGVMNGILNSYTDRKMRVNCGDLYLDASGKLTVNGPEGDGIVTGTGITGDFGDYRFVNGICTGYSG